MVRSSGTTNISFIKKNLFNFLRGIVEVFLFYRNKHAYSVPFVTCFFKMQFSLCVAESILTEAGCAGVV